MNKLAIAMFGSLLAFSVAVPANAQRVVDDFGDTVTDEATLEVGEYPVVGLGDWRTPNADVPWSVPVYVVDEFEGNYLAVIDKNYQKNIWASTETGVFSNWSRRTLRIFAYFKYQNCGAFFCSNKTEIRETRAVKILVGGEVFDLSEGSNGNYPISEELAYALANAPQEKAKIKIYLEESGEEIISDIGKGTVTAWGTVYQDAMFSEADVSETELDALSPTTGITPEN